MGTKQKILYVDWRWWETFRLQKNVSGLGIARFYLKCLKTQIHTSQDIHIQVLIWVILLCFCVLYLTVDCTFTIFNRPLCRYWAPLWCSTSFPNSGGLLVIFGVCCIQILWTKCHPYITHQGLFRVEFTCSHSISESSLLVLWLPTTVQRHPMHIGVSVGLQ